MFFTCFPLGQLLQIIEDLVHHSWRYQIDNITIILISTWAIVITVYINQGISMTSHRRMPLKTLCFLKMSWKHFDCCPPKSYFLQWQIVQIYACYWETLIMSSEHAQKFCNHNISCHTGDQYITISNPQIFFTRF